MEMDSSIVDGHLGGNSIIKKIINNRGVKHSKKQFGVLMSLF